MCSSSKTGVKCGHILAKLGLFGRWESLDHINTYLVIVWLLHRLPAQPASCWSQHWHCTGVGTKKKSAECWSLPFHRTSHEPVLCGFECCTWRFLHLGSVWCTQYAGLIQGTCCMWCLCWTGLTQPVDQHVALRRLAGPDEFDTFGLEGLLRSLPALLVFDPTIKGYFEATCLGSYLTNQY